MGLRFVRKYGRRHRQHLATLTRNDLRYGTHPTDPVVPTLAEPTPTQRHVYDLLGAPIPLTIGGK